MRLCALAVFGLLGCAGGEQATRAPEAPRVAEAPKPTGSDPEAPAPPPTAHAEGPAPSAPRFSEADQADQNFVVNARRAIGEYRSFIEKAGNDEAYAEAVSRSRERIADLEQMIAFVLNGRAARANETSE